MADLVCVPVGEGGGGLKVRISYICEKASVVSILVVVVPPYNDDIKKRS